MVTAVGFGNCGDDHFSVRRPRRSTSFKVLLSLERGQYSLVRTVGIRDHEVTLALDWVSAHKSEAFAVRRESDRTSHVLDQLLGLTAKDRNRVKRARKVVS